MTVAIVVLVPLLAVIPGVIAKRKGDSFATFWLFGVLLFIVALPYVLLMGDKRRRCEHCDEEVRRDAKVCRHCGRDLAEVPVTRPAVDASA